MTRSARTLIVLFMSMVWAACQGAGTTDVYVLYPDDSGLERGNPVKMNDFVVGEVKAIELEPDGRVAVQVRMYPKYKDYVTEGSTFAVRRESWLEPGRFIDLQVGDGQPVADGARFEGVVSVEDRIKGLTDRFLDSIQNTDLKKTFEDLAAAADSAARVGKEHWEERRPEIEADARELLQELEKQGNEAADRLRKRLEEYLEELETDPDKETKSIQI